MKPIDKALALVREIAEQSAPLGLPYQGWWDNIGKARQIVRELDQMEEALQNGNEYSKMEYGILDNKADQIGDVLQNSKDDLQSRTIVDDEADAQHNTRPSEKLVDMANEIRDEQGKASKKIMRNRDYV